MISGRLGFSGDLNGSQMSDDERFFRGIDAKPVNLFFELTAFGSPKERFQKG
jgi:hypothetical protein